MNEVTIWLVRLLTAHLLTEFCLQPRSWVEAKRRYKLKANKFWYHTIITTLVAAWFTCFDTWWVLPAIFITHLLIDWWKAYKPDTLAFLLIDQLLHISVIGAIWYGKFYASLSIMRILQTCHIDKNYWFIGMAIIFLTVPVGIFIGKVTGNYAPPSGQNSGRANAGKIIGILERLVVFFLVMQSQYEAIGLLVAAKSIIRIKDEEREMSEYVLIGTLYSISIAIATGFFVTKIIEI